MTIAIAKGTAAVLTGSPALFAETLHTVADAGNEVLLFVALRRSRRPPDQSHPLGYGPERYYWALLAAVGMFVVGGALSVWEGVRALIHPPELEAFWAGVIVLVIALVLDSVSRAIALRELRRQAEQRGVTVRELLRESPDPTVVTVYLEDSIDVLGAGLALVALVLHHVTDSAVPDALATIVIGLLLGYVAVRLTGRNRQLLANQGVPERYIVQLRERLTAAAGVHGVARLEAVYLGPGEVLVAADVRMEDGLSGDEVTAVLARIRDEAARELPVIARLYLTPVALERGVDRVRPAGHLQVAQPGRLAARRAYRRRVELRAAAVLEHDRLGARVQVPVAPLLEREQDRVQLVARLGQLVLVARWALGVRAPLDDPGVLELAQPRREHVARGAGGRLEAGEPRVAVADLAHDQQRVAIADDAERVGDRADPLSGLVSDSFALVPRAFGIQTYRRLS